MELNARPLIEARDTLPALIVPDAEAEVSAPVIDLVYEDNTAEHWAALAREYRQIAREHFELSSTLKGAARADLETQGREALHLSRRHDLCAELAETGGIRTFPALFYTDGTLVADATYVRTVHREWVWRLGTGETALWFRPSRAATAQARRASDLKRGYLVGLIRARAYIRTGATQARGSGVHVWHYVSRDPSSPVEIIDTGTIEGYGGRSIDGR